LVTASDYLRDLGDLLWNMAEEARADAADDYERGRAFGLYEAVSLVEQQAASFGLSSDKVGLGGRRAEDLLQGG
jgi:hypothetical protein